MLDAVAELGQHLVRYVERILRDKIDTDAFRANQSDDLLDLVEQRFRRVGEQKVSLIEEEAEFGLGLIANFRQLLEQFGKQPQEEGGIEAWTAHQFIRRKYIDVSAPVLVGADEILEHKRGLAEELVAALILQHQQLALDGPDRSLGHIAVMDCELGSMFRDVAQHGPQVLEIEHEKPLLVGDPKANVQHAFLNFIQIHQA